MIYTFLFFLKVSGQNISQQISTRTYFSPQEWNEDFIELLSLLKFRSGSAESYLLQATWPLVLSSDM